MRNWIRVYIDTNIIGSFLRDFPHKITDFKKAEENGFRYYAGTDGISELACNSKLDSLKTQISVLRELVSDQCFYLDPEGLLRSELQRLHGSTPKSLLAPRDEVARILPFFIHNHADQDFNRMRAEHLAGNREYFKSDKTIFNKILGFAKEEFDGFPVTFDEYWTRALTSGNIAGDLLSMTQALSHSLSAKKLHELMDALSQYKAFHAHALIKKIHAFARLMKLLQPDKGDGIDFRHAVSAAYCDIFLTRDENFRKLLAIGKTFLPYTCMAPEYFLSAPSAHAERFHQANGA